MTATTSNCASVTRPAKMTITIHSMAAARTRSGTTINGLRGYRSARAPAGSRISAAADMPAKLTTPANVAEWVAARASSGYTTVVMLDPVAETTCPVHSSMKSRLRRSGRASPEGCAPGCAGCDSASCC